MIEPRLQSLRPAQDDRTLCGRRVCEGGWVRTREERWEVGVGGGGARGEGIERHWGHSQTRYATVRSAGQFSRCDERLLKLLSARPGRAAGLIAFTRSEGPERSPELPPRPPSPLLHPRPPPTPLLHTPPSDPAIEEKIACAFACTSTTSFSFASLQDKVISRSCFDVGRSASLWLHTHPRGHARALTGLLMISS